MVVHLFLCRVIYHSTLAECLRGARLVSMPQGFMNNSSMLLKGIVMLATGFQVYVYVVIWTRSLIIHIECLYSL